MVALSDKRMAYCEKQLKAARDNGVAADFVSTAEKKRLADEKAAEESEDGILLLQVNLFPSRPREFEKHLVVQESEGLQRGIATVTPDQAVLPRGAVEGHVSGERRSARDEGVD